MEIGIVGGTGPLGRGLGVRLADSGARVVIGSRDAARAEQVVKGLLGRWPGRPLQIAGASNTHAAERAELVVAATPWDSVVPTMLEMTVPLRDKVVVSVGNALVKQGRELLPLALARGSVAAGLQAALPGSLVAAACHHLPSEPLEDLDHQLGFDVLVCSDQARATEETMAMIGRIRGLRPLHAGSLALAGAVEGFTAVLATMNIRYKVRSSVRFAGMDAPGVHVGGEVREGDRGPAAG